MSAVSNEAQQIAGDRIVVGKDCGVPERLKCQNTIQVEKPPNVFHNEQMGKGGIETPLLSGITGR
jgi:hypothetical protein